MKQKIKIVGLDCPNCAKSLEKAINKLESINFASIDFFNGTIIFEAEKISIAIKDIIRVTKQVEPEAKIILDDEFKNNFRNIILDTAILLTGIILTFITLIMEKNNIYFYIMFLVSALVLGYKTYYKAIELLLNGIVNENLLLTVSVFGAAFLGEFNEALMVIGLYSIGKVFESLALNKSRKSIECLTNLQIEKVTILDNNQEKIVAPDSVEVGSVIIVKPGERVAIDGIVIDGEANLNMQSLTGESMPILVSKDSVILSGSIVMDGLIQIKTTYKYSDSTVNKILSLIETASNNKSKTETVISKISKWYTLGVIIASFITFILVYWIMKDVETAIYRGLNFLVISCPCAFAISVPLAYFSGIGNGSKHGVLFKGSNYLDACSKISTVAFDKTGTLTTGDFSIQAITTYNNFTKEEILYIASLGEQNSLHPIAKAILKENERKLEQVYNVREIAGLGVYFTYDDNNYFVGRKKEEWDNDSTLVCVFSNNEKIGEILLKDSIKATSCNLIKELTTFSINNVILSGDNEKSVSYVANSIGISEYYYNLLPQDKYKKILKLKKANKEILAYVGDGLNDAPSLMAADIGISMGINGSDASIEASDIVIVDDDPYKILTAIKISKYTRIIVIENIVLSMGIKLLFLILAMLGITGMSSAVFADVGVTLLAIFNSMRALFYKAK